MLKVLPSNISNLIAAGEVVTRPAAVVKELVENAIDAGAKNVSVIILDAGRTLIQIIDDGCGMTEDEAVLCFERHATSKIATTEDLDKIATYGFRGEALASIAAVAEVTLKTKKADEEIGHIVEMAASQFISKGAVSTPVGTNISVRNLFYNIPARRKFLKSDNAELRHIISEFIRVALTRPQRALKLTSNGRDIYNLRSVSNYKQRIHDIFGSNLDKELVEITTDTSIVKLYGFIGDPEDAKKSSSEQFFFINGRYFRSPFFHKAVCKPYEKLIPDGYIPSYFLYMDCDLDKVDVNIHPAKTEIKFEDEGVIFEIIQASVKEGLGKNSFIPSIDFDSSEMVDMPNFNSKPSNSGYTPQPKINFNPLFNPFDTPKEFELPQTHTPSIQYSGNYGTLFEKEQELRENTLLQIQGKYIITPAKSGLMVVNIQRARERIFYERYLEALENEVPISQQSLFPQSIVLTPDNYILLKDNLEQCTKLGFDIRDFCDNTVMVYGVPDGFSTDEKSISDTIDDLISSLKEDEFLDDYKHKSAEDLARSAARNSGEKMNQATAQLLLEQLFACRQAEMTADGRKTMTIITIEELDKKI